jgi:hypothetical protein
MEKESTRESKNIFNKNNNKEYFKELFMNYLSPTFLNLFKNNNKLFYNQSFIEGLSYEFGLMDKTKDIKEAFKVYKDGSDSKNDYLCMYRLYIIYLNDYEIFGIKKDKDLETIYLFKCFAYLPYSVINGNYFIFNKINITYEVALYIDNHYSQFNDFENFIQQLNENKEKYNLTENNIKLMENIIKIYFYSSKNKSYIKQLEEGDNEGRLKYNNFYLDLFKNNFNNDDLNKIRNNFERLINDKYYKAAYDYGHFLIKEKKYNEAKNILKLGIDNSQQSCLSLYIYLVLKEIELKQLLLDYDKIKDILHNMCLSICLDKLNYSSFFYAFYYLSKHSSFKEQLKNDFIKYITEIYNNFNKEIKAIEEIEADIRYKINILYIFGQMNYYGILEEIKPDKEKALSFFKKSYNFAKNNGYIHFIRKNYIYIYKCRKYLYKNNKIKKEKYDKTKNKLIALINVTTFTSFELYNCYKVYKDKEKSQISIALSFLKRANNKEIVYNFKDYVYKEKCEIALNNTDNIICEMCCINQNQKNYFVLKPCKHLICQGCFDKGEKKEECPICGIRIESKDNNQTNK